MGWPPRSRRPAKELCSRPWTSAPPMWWLPTTTKPPTLSTWRLAERKAPGTVVGECQKRGCGQTRGCKFNISLKAGLTLALTPPDPFTDQGGWQASRRGSGGGAYPARRQASRLSDGVLWRGAEKACMGCEANHPSPVGPNARLVADTWLRFLDKQHAGFCSESFAALRELHCFAHSRGEV